MPEWLFSQHISRTAKTTLIWSGCKILQGENEIMKTTKLVLLVMTIAVALFILIPNLSWAADDGATLYKAKCAACHGVDATGKPAAKIPSLVGDDVKKLSDDDLGKAITATAKHPGPVKSLTPDQVKMTVTYIRSLQK
jgi:mono/diheme cytochrome c family protein